MSFNRYAQLFHLLRQRPVGDVRTVLLQALRVPWDGADFDFLVQARAYAVVHAVLHDQNQNPNQALVQSANQVGQPPAEPLRAAASSSAVGVVGLAGSGNVGPVLRIPVEVTSQVRFSASSGVGRLPSLVDGSTESFWESGDGDNLEEWNRQRETHWLTLTFPEPTLVSEVCCLWDVERDGSAFPHRVTVSVQVCYSAQLPPK